MRTYVRTYFMLCTFSMRRCMFLVLTRSLVRLVSVKLSESMCFVTTIRCLILLSCLIKSAHTKARGTKGL